MSAKHDERPHRPGPRVLVVDDDPLLATLMADALTRRGVSATVAHAAEEALDLVARFRPHVALLDIGLPSIDGHELGLRLRAAMSGSLSLIAVTGYDEPWARQRSSELGFAAHLIKPVSLPQLRRLIGELAAPQ